MLIFWPLMSATVLPFFEHDAVVAVGEVADDQSVVSTPPAAGIVSASMLVSVTPSNLPAVYWLMDST